MGISGSGRKTKPTAFPISPNDGNKSNVPTFLYAVVRLAHSFIPTNSKAHIAHPITKDERLNIDKKASEPMQSTSTIVNKSESFFIL
jgi:hypothetical protein